MLVARALEPNTGDAVLDSCAAQAENNAYRGTIKGNW